MTRKPQWETYFAVGGLLLVLIGTYMGLFVAPPERHMGEVVRILYIHVPSAQVSMLIYTAAFGFAIASLWTRRAKWDGVLAACVEVGVVLNALLLIQGSLWGRATWGVWWDWDVRLTTSLIMLLLFAGILVLRGFVHSIEQRAVWTAVATIVAFADVPLVYFCVRWWRSLHQTQSTVQSVASAMALPLNINKLAFVLGAVWLIARRARLEMARRRMEEVDEPAKLPRQDAPPAPSAPGESES